MTTRASTPTFRTLACIPEPAAPRPREEEAGLTDNAKSGRKDDVEELVGKAAKLADAAALFGRHLRRRAHVVLDKGRRGGAVVATAFELRQFARVSQSLANIDMVFEVRVAVCGESLWRRRGVQRHGGGCI